MPALLYATGAYQRLVTGLPELRVHNCYVEPSPVNGGAPVLVARPALAAFRSEAGQSVRALFQRDGVLAGKLVTVAASVRVGETVIGSLPGDELVRIAAGEGEMLACANGGIFRLTESTLAPVAFPDDAAVADVDFLRGRFLAVRADTGQFYWSGLLTSSGWDGIGFATAERQADPLVACRTLGDEVWLFGSATVEIWQPGLDADLPFVPIDGRVYQRGCIGRDTVAAVDNTLFWVAPEGVVYRGAAVPERVSTHSIEERISKGSGLSAWSFTWRGHEFYALRIEGQGTWLYDAATREWCDWASYGFIGWDAWCGCNVDAEVYAGSVRDGTVWRLSDEASEDADGPIQRIFTALAPVQEPTAAWSLEVATATGRGTLGASPVIEVRSSRDQGNTWSAWRQAPVGGQGEYRTRAVWRRFGLIDRPGMVFEFRITDAAPFRVSNVVLNELVGGRGR